MSKIFCNFSVAKAPPRLACLTRKPGELPSSVEGPGRLALPDKTSGLVADFAILP
jgi:hypothetical protein